MKFAVGKIDFLYSMQNLLNMPKLHEMLWAKSHFCHFEAFIMLLENMFQNLSYLMDRKYV